MKISIAMLSVIVLSGCYDTREGRPCAQERVPMGGVENRTGVDQNIEMSFLKRDHSRDVVQIAVPANSSIDQTLAPMYSEMRYGYSSMSGPRDASCSGVERDGTYLRLTNASFATVKACTVSPGWVILIPLNEDCVEFAKEQTQPL